MQQQLRTRTRPGGEPPTSPAWSRVVKQFDFHPKAPEEDIVQKRSKYGGAVTIVCSLVLLFLVASEIIEYVRPQTVDVLTVDTRRGEKMPINVDIFFPSMSCLDVTVDVVEASGGETLEDATHQIFKQRIDNAGKGMTEGLQAELGNPEIKLPGKCFPCVPISPPHTLARFFKGRAADANTCCPTCSDVREYLRQNHLPQTAAEQTPQCKVVQPFGDDEGCHVRGFLQVPRGKGDFHIAAGAGFSQRHEEHQHHIHQIDWSRLNKFNITHIVNSLSFGPPIPNLANPLDNHFVLASTLAQHIYMIQVIPTTYDAGGQLLFTHQYSFTQHHHHVKMGNDFVLPGVYFRYDINPLMIHIHAKNFSFANFVTRLCAIIGGLYVVFGIVYSLTAKVVKTAKKKT